MNNEGFATRFVSLSSLPNPDSKTAFKDKYLHALSIKPLVHSTHEELTEAEFGGVTDQSKLAPGLRNPFLPPKGGDTDDYLVQEKLQLGIKLMEEKKLTKDDDPDDSDESVQEIRNGISTV